MGEGLAIKGKGGVFSGCHMSPRTARRLIVVAVLVGGLWLAHGWLLYVAARPLVCDEPYSEATFLFLQGSEYGIEGAELLPGVVAWQQQSAARRILLLDPAPRRAAELGVVQSFAALARKELRRQGIPDAAILTLSTAACDDWDKAHFLAGWIAEHAGAKTAILSSRFHSGKQRLVFRRVLGEEAARVSIVACPSPDYDERSWWHSRPGVRAFMFAWIDRGYLSWQGEQSAPRRRLSAAQYIALLENTYGEARP
jgi:hypothetical protein